MASKVTGPIDPESKFWDHLIEQAANKAGLMVYMNTKKGRNECFANEMNNSGSTQ